MKEIYEEKVKHVLQINEFAKKIEMRTIESLQEILNQVEKNREKVSFNKCFLLNTI